MVDVFITWLPQKTKEEEAYVSSQSPGFEKLPPEEEEERMLQLYDDLMKIGIPPEKIKPTQFYDTETGYTESSFYIEGIDVEDALALAERYGQAEILTDAGIVDVKNKSLRVPTREKITGDEALKQKQYSIVEGGEPVSYQFASPEPRGKPKPEVNWQAEPDRMKELKQQYMELADSAGDDIMKLGPELGFSSVEVDTLITLQTQAKEAVMQDDLPRASNLLLQLLGLLEKKGSPSPKGINTL